MHDNVLKTSGRQERTGSSRKQGNEGIWLCFVKAPDLFHDLFQIHFPNGQIFQPGAIAGSMIMAGGFVDHRIFGCQMNLSGMRELENLPGIVFPHSAPRQNLKLIAIEILQAA